MTSSDDEPTDKLLRRWTGGDDSAGEELYRRIEATLHRRAHALLVEQGRPATLDTASLVHEAWLRLIEPGAGVDANDRDHFLALAARAMRSVVVDRARARGAIKRGGAVRRVALEEGLVTIAPDHDLVLDLDEALERLRALDEHRHRVAELRLFGGLEHVEIGRVMGTSSRTVERIWRATRAWLERELDPD